jgi:hypothetical protein
LYLSDTLKKESGYNITELNFSNTSIGSKAGIYIGDALLKNPNYPIRKLLFSGVCLE